MTLTECSASGAGNVQMALVAVTNGKVVANTLSMASITFSGRSAITVTGGVADFTKLNMDKVTGAVALVNVAGISTSVAVDDSSITDASLGTIPAVFANKAKRLLVNNTVFSKLTRTSGNGGAIYADLTSADTITMARCSFSECKTSTTAGLGGAIYIHLNCNTKVSVILA